MRGFRTSLLAASLLSLPAAMLGQAEPAASVSNAMPSNNFGFNLPSKIGTLSYSVTASEQIESGYSGGGVYADTSFSGNLGYLSRSENDPFSLVYSGGVSFGNVPGTSNTQFYQNVAASQVYRTRAWVFVASDSFSYLPDSPTTGLSGIAGVGDVGVLPVQTGIGPAQGILTNFSSRVANGVQGSATWQTTPSLDLEGSGSWQILKFTGDNPGYNTNDISATFGPNYRIDARNSAGASAYYSRQTYPSYRNYLIETEGVSGNYSRAWSRRLNTTLSLGPARTHGTTIAPVPSQWNLSGSASLTYATRTTGLFASYDRSVNGGSGVIFGSLSDSVTLGMNRPINRDWILGLDLGYSHNVGLTPIAGVVPSYDSVFGAAQISRRLTETLSMYGSYTAISQSAKNQSSAQLIGFNGLNHIVSIGITFAPAPLLRGR
ncbi:MAG TPA: hypothetical protein VN734_11175 [Acidobacteriaceae bacterium]|nr:hypothetical protein [Acidobacteriaceae bacterium]